VADTIQNGVTEALDKLAEALVVDQPPIDLQRFCDTEPSQYTIQSPWIFDGWRYATDGTIAVRFPVPGEANTPDIVDPGLRQRKFPRAYTVFENFPACVTGFPLPAASVQCDGKGKVADGNGDKCRFCDGRKRVPENTSIGARKLAGKYLSILADIPDLRIHLAGDKESPLAFVSGRLQGLLMPLVRD
jgi:hypothetical protein